MENIVFHSTMKYNYRIYKSFAFILFEKNMRLSFKEKKKKKLYLQSDKYSHNAIWAPLFIFFFTPYTFSAPIFI